MKWKATIFAAALLAGCASPNTDQSLDSSYGSLSFKGDVTRRVEGTNYVYTVRQLDLAFDPTARTNATERVANASLRLAATIKTSAGKPNRVTFESLVPLQAQLDASNRAASVGNLEFVVPQNVVEAADHVGLAVVSDRLMWPLGPELKR